MLLRLTCLVAAEPGCGWRGRVEAAQRPDDGFSGRMAAWAKIYVDNIDVLGVYMFTSYSCRRQVVGRRMPADREETMAVADEAARRRKACGPRM